MDIAEKEIAPSPDPGNVPDPVEMSMELRRDVRLARYGNDMGRRADALRRALPRIRERDELSFWKALNSVVELYDYLGRYAEASEVLQEFQSVGPNLIPEGAENKKRPQGPQEHALEKSRIWLWIHIAQSWFRNHKYSEAVELLNRCLKRAEFIRDEADNQYCVTRGRAHFRLGQCCRQMGDFSTAEGHYLCALELSYAGIENRRKQIECGKFANADEKERAIERYQQEQAAASHRVALALSAGYGFMFSTTGDLTRAEMCISSARVLLETTGDWLHKAYVELLSGSVRRAKAGLNPDKLREAISSSERAYRVFQDQKHIYQARAAYELSQAYTYLRSFKKAEEYANEVLEFGRSKSDDRWLSNGLLVLSRIQRRRGSPVKAQMTAQKSIDIASRSRLATCHTDALIARGEASFDQRKYEDARHDFEDAVNGSANLKVKAVCALHLTRTLLEEKRLSEAERAWATWMSVKDRVQHALIHALASEVNGKLNEHIKGFTIEPGEKKLDLNHHVSALKEYLARTAVDRFQGIGKAADALGVSAQTVYNLAGSTYISSRLHSKPRQQTPLNSQPLKSGGDRRAPQRKNAGRKGRRS
jgi:tetratricopeptide (TPR) repeat protein